MPENEDESEITEEKDWLEEDGICFFPGPEARLPTDVRISSPDIGVLDLISGLVIKNPEGPGIITIAYNSIKNEKDPLPAKIFGVVVDADVIKAMRSEDPDFILLKSPNGNKWINLDQWFEEFGTNGFALIAKMRLFWNKYGGGVQTGRSLKDKSEKKFKKLGVY